MYATNLLIPVHAVPVVTFTVRCPYSAVSFLQNPNAIPRYNGPRYNGTPLCFDYWWPSGVRFLSTRKHNIYYQFRKFVFCHLMVLVTLLVISYICTDYAMILCWYIASGYVLWPLFWASSFAKGKQIYFLYKVVIEPNTISKFTLIYLFYVIHLGRNTLVLEYQYRMVYPHWPWTNLHLGKYFSSESGYQVFLWPMAV